MPAAARLLAAEKNLLRDRNTFLLLHPSFGRKNKDFTTGRLGSWQCEDMARLIGCFVPLLFRPLAGAGGPMPGEGFVLEALGHLRQFWEFHTRQSGFGSPEELATAANEAREHLLAYGRLVEQVRLCDGSYHLANTNATAAALDHVHMFLRMLRCGPSSDTRQAQHALSAATLRRPFAVILLQYTACQPWLHHTTPHMQPSDALCALCGMCSCRRGSCAPSTCICWRAG